MNVPKNKMQYIHCFISPYLIDKRNVISLVFKPCNWSRSEISRQGELFQAKDQKSFYLWESFLFIPLYELHQLPTPSRIYEMKQS